MHMLWNSPSWPPCSLFSPNNLYWMSCLQIKGFKRSSMANNVYFFIQKLIWSQCASLYFISRKMENQVIDLNFTQWPSFVCNTFKLKTILWWCKHIDVTTTWTLVVAINFCTKFEINGDISIWECIICNNKINKTKTIVKTIDSFSNSINTKIKDTKLADTKEQKRTCLKKTKKHHAWRKSLCVTQWNSKNYTKITCQEKMCRNKIELHKETHGNESWRTMSRNDESVTIFANFRHNVKSSYFRQNVSLGSTQVWKKF
jgi:hypothetical protein